MVNAIVNVKALDKKKTRVIGLTIKLDLPQFSIIEFNDIYLDKTKDIAHLKVSINIIWKIKIIVIYL